MDNTSQKQIVVLGGSYGGVSTAHYVLKHVIPQLSDAASYRLILISASNLALCRPACPRAMISDSVFDQEKLFVNIEQCFKQYPAQQFEFIQSTVTSVNIPMRSIAFTRDGVQSDISFHILVIATGASTPSPLLGLNSIPEELRVAWNSFRTDLSKAQSIIVVGGGPAGVETAAELAEYSSKHLHGQNSANIKITLVTSAHELLPILRQSIARQAEEQLVRLGVTVIKNTRIEKMESVDEFSASAPGSKVRVTLADGNTMSADLYISATGTSPNTGFLNSEFLHQDGRIKTDNTLRVTGVGEGIYAIGDASSFARPAIHNILAGVPVLCANMKRDLEKMNGSETYPADRFFREDKRETQIVLLGQKRAVGAVMGWNLPSFLIRLIKRDYWLWTTPRLWSGRQW